METALQSQSSEGKRIPRSAVTIFSILLALTAGLALRLWMLSNFFEVNGDSLIYGELAKNLLTHGTFAQTQTGGELHATLIRLPGYPLFLAACFRIFGMENYASAPWVQIAMDLAGCLLVAGFVRRIVPPALANGAAHCTLWLAALCPFTAIYAAEPLTEAPTLYCLALALWSAACFRQRPRWAMALWFTFAVTFAALLRPDGALVAVALAPVLMMGWGWGRTREGSAGAKTPSQFGAFSARLKSCPGTSGGSGDSIQGISKVSPVTKPKIAAAGTAATGQTSAAGIRGSVVRMLVVCVLLAITPFAAWTWRNWQVFHVFQPLAPRMAADPGEDTHPGWERWVKSWCLDFNSTYDVYWNVPLGPLDISKLPRRAFDSAAQYAQTVALAADYNSNGQLLTHAIDQRFGRLAEERVAAHPLRSYLWLPLGRVADMWLRPRVENLPIDLDWWAYGRHHQETLFSWGYLGLNALYLALAGVGLWLRPRFWGAMLAYVALRSAMLLSVAAPEARYTIECFPILFALGGIGAWWGMLKIGALGKRMAG